MKAVIKGSCFAELEFVSLYLSKCDSVITYIALNTCFVGFTLNISDNISKCLGSFLKPAPS